eukprot:scaffold3043_cov121-Cylindrotheca_fusiformis.AAC.10
MESNGIMNVFGDHATEKETQQSKTESSPWQRNYVDHAISNKIMRAPSRKRLLLDSMDQPSQSSQSGRRSRVRVVDAVDLTIGRSTSVYRVGTEDELRKLCKRWSSSRISFSLYRRNIDQ